MTSQLSSKDIRDSWRRWKVKRWEHIFHTEICSFLHSTSWIFYDKCLRRNLGRVRWGLEGHSDMNSGIEELTILNRYFSWPGAWVHGWPWMAFGMVSAGLPRCSTLSQGECFSWLQSSLGKGIFSKGISQHVLDSAWHGLWFGRHFRIYCIQVSHPNARKSISVFAARISKKKSSQNEEIKLIGPSVVHQILLPCPYGAGLSKICTWRCCSNLGGRWMWMWRAKHFFERPSNLFLPFVSYQTISISSGIRLEISWKGKAIYAKAGAVRYNAGRCGACSCASGFFGDSSGFWHLRSSNGCLARQLHMKDCLNVSVLANGRNLVLS